MFDIDDNVARKPVFAQPRQSGQFFKSGCSVAPASPPKLKEGKRGYGKQFAHSNAPAPLSAAPVPIVNRIAPKRCQIAANGVRRLPVKDD